MVPSPGLLTAIYTGAATDAEHVHLTVLAANTDAPYRRAVMADGNTKLSHYSKAATATRDIPSSTHTYFDSREGGLEHEVQNMHSSGKLSLKGVIPQQGRQERDEVAHDLGHGKCTTNLHCARLSAAASANKPCDIHGVVGWCCSHGIPLRGVYCNMPTPEQFCFYLLSLGRLTKQCSELDVYIDFGCRFKVTWERYLASLDLPEKPDVHIMVNWMHGASHQMSCQLQNCGRFQDGAGARVGEQMEQLWSLLKVCVA